MLRVAKVKAVPVNGSFHSHTREYLFSKPYVARERWRNEPYRRKRGTNADTEDRKKRKKACPQKPFCSQQRDHQYRSVASRRAKYSECPSRILMRRRKNLLRHRMRSNGGNTYKSREKGAHCRRLMACLGRRALTTCIRNHPSSSRPCLSHPSTVVLQKIFRNSSRSAIPLPCLWAGNKFAKENLFFDNPKSNRNERAEQPRNAGEPDSPPVTRVLESLGKVFEAASNFSIRTLGLNRESKRNFLNECVCFIATYVTITGAIGRRVSDFLVSIDRRSYLEQVP